MSLGTHIFEGPVDFRQNELRNAKFQNLFIPPPSPKEGQIYYDSFHNIPYYWNETKWIPFGQKPVHKNYLSEAQMIADQEKHLDGYLYFDGDTYYEYLGTTNSNISDYRPISPKKRNNRVKTLYINPSDLSGVGLEEDQICNYINANKEIIYSEEFSKLNIIVGINKFDNNQFTYTFPFNLS